VTEPGRPALSLDPLEAVVFDTDGVLADTAIVHAAAWMRLFDVHYRLRAARDPADPPGHETVCGLDNTKDRFFVADLDELVLQGAPAGRGGP
jgi:beta-phosphoglucomutase-like phosphatase (HAD superfamily)